MPERQESENGFLRFDERRRFFELVQDLPPRQKQTIVLRYLFDLSDHTIAQLLEVSVATVRSQAQHALRKLRVGHEVTAGRDLS